MTKIQLPRVRKSHSVRPPDCGAASATSLRSPIAISCTRARATATLGRHHPTDTLHGALRLRLRRRYHHAPRGSYAQYAIAGMLA